MDGVIIQNPGPDDITYEFRGYDQYGDGFGSNCYTNIGGQTAPIGTWQTTNTGYPAPSILTMVVHSVTGHSVLVALHKPH